MLLAAPVLLAASHAAAAIFSRTSQQFSEVSALDQSPPHISTSNFPQDSEAFIVNIIGDLSASLKIEESGIANIAAKEAGPHDTFVLEGNTLLSNKRSSHCFISQDHNYLACEDVPKKVPQTTEDFSLANNGSLLYNGSANWWACLAEDLGGYNVYYQKISPNCKSIQLQSRLAPKTKRILFEHSVNTTSPDHTDLATRIEKTCWFHMRIPYNFDAFVDLNEKLKKGFPYTMLGKRLGTGPNGFHYCYISAATFRLICADKASEDLMENFHSIDFSINEKGFLIHNGVQDWVFCKTSKGWDGPYSEKKISDAKCEAVTVQIMVTTIPGYDCRPQVTKPSVVARAAASRVNTCIFDWWTPEIDNQVDHESYESRYDYTRRDIRYKMQGDRLYHNFGSNDRCFVNETSSQLICLNRWTQKKIGMTGNTTFSLDSKTGRILHDGQELWHECYRDRKKYTFTKKPDLTWVNLTCSITPVVALYPNCWPQATMVAASKDLSKRELPASEELVALKHEPKKEAPQVLCPTNLVGTLFKSPTLLVPISSESKSKSLGAVKNITITPTQSTIFKFFIPSTKPYKDQECALILLLPVIDHLSIDYQEGQIPGLQFFEVGGPVDEHTTFDTLPISPLLVSKTFPNEIRPGKNNFITSLACGGGVKSIMITSKGGLSLGVKQEGVPNESGLHLVPCVAKVD